MNVRTLQPTYINIPIQSILKETENYEEHHYYDECDEVLQARGSDPRGQRRPGDPGTGDVPACLSHGHQQGPSEVLSEVI